MAKLTNKTSKKKTSKKKTTRKKATKKKATKKKTAHSKRKQREEQRPDPVYPTLPAVPDEETRRRWERERLEQEELEERIRIWEAYDRLHAARAVAFELGISEKRVRSVLDEDRERLRAILDSHLEAVVARWEQGEARSLNLMHECLSLAEGIMLEIKTAAREGRATRIMDGDGMYMTVPSAVEWVVMSKLMDQAKTVAVTARQHAAPYRDKDQARRDAEEAGKVDPNDFSEMSAEQLADVIEEGGFKLPPFLMAKVKGVASTSRRRGDDDPVGPGD